MRQRLVSRMQTSREAPSRPKSTPNRFDPIEDQHGTLSSSFSLLYSLALLVSAGGSAADAALFMVQDCIRTVYSSAAAAARETHSS